MLFHFKILHMKMICYNISTISTITIFQHYTQCYKMFAVIMNVIGFYAENKRRDVGKRMQKLLEDLHFLAYTM